MEMPETESIVTKRPVWNAGRPVCAERALKPKQIWVIRFYLNQPAACEIARCSTLRSTASCVVATSCKNRGPGQRRTNPDPRNRNAAENQSTCSVRTAPGRSNQSIGLARTARWHRARLCLSCRVDHNGHLSTRQYARLVDQWVTGVGRMRSEYGTHSLRRTKA